MLNKEIAGFFKLGVSLLVGACDAHLRPECARAVGARAEPDGEHITVFLAEACAGPMARALKENGRIALTASHPKDHRSVQFKGSVVSMGRAPDADRALVEAHVARHADVLDPLGMPRTFVLRMSHWPALAVRFRVEEMYLQTPGPGAGKPFEKGGAL